mmetsp:Transcript_5299/g.10127  ORF Transcript_5299/g.10127 Transcript_5299/m.10127 type:complete len:233 (-) Transcript_5299:693-1391(-)
MGCGSSKPDTTKDVENKPIKGRSSEAIGNLQRLCPLLLKALESIRRRELDDVWIRRYSGDVSVRRHQLVFFCKPEILDVDAGVCTEAVLQMLLSKFTMENIDVGAVRVLGGAALEQANIMSEHYGVISKISREGHSALTDDAKAKLKEHFPSQSLGDVMGAHQFLEKVGSAMGAEALSKLSTEKGPTKLAGGSYALPVEVGGKTYLVLNPFHPSQLVPYNNPKNSIVVMELR